MPASPTRQKQPPPRPAAAPPKREKGPPPAGASSMHLTWTIAAPARSARAIIEITTPPPVGSELYFWALQARFVDAEGSGDYGGAHVGLQWHKDFPGSTAVNWGGYTPQGVELNGSTSPLPSATNNPNTRNYSWKPRRRYELAIKPVAGGWAGVVTDLVTRQATTIRTLYVGGARLVDIVVWSEVFAACDDPTVEARWSGFEAAGRKPSTVTVNYQDYSDGGCTNTNQAKAGLAVAQRTKTRRTTPDGQAIRL